MKSEALAIQIEEWNRNTVLVLQGRFHSQQTPNIREKIHDLLESGNRSFILDLTDVTELDDEISLFLLELLNTIKGKGGTLRIVYGTTTVLTALEKHRNLFDLAPDRKSLFSAGLLKRLHVRGITLSRRTGVRLSRAVAVLLLVALTGWFLSLLAILIMQNARVRTQKTEMEQLQEWKRKTSKKIEILQERLHPLEDLGIAKDDTLLQD